MRGGGGEQRVETAGGVELAEVREERNNQRGPEQREKKRGL